MVLKMTRGGGGGWSSRARAQQWPRFSKLGLKGLSDYISNEIAVEASRWEASGLKKGYSQEISTVLKERELDNSSKPNRIRAKGSPSEKTTAVKKELLTLFPGSVAEES
jgi:hypothetical protein